PTTTAPAAAPPPSALVDLAGRGIYRLPYEDLAPLGLAAGDPHNLRLFRGQDEVAWDWQGDEDAMFEPGEALLFYGEPRFSRWSELDSYRLLADDSPGLRMQAGSADPAGLPAGRAWIERLYEENHLYTPDCFCGHLPAGRDGDRWTWQLLRRPDPFQESFQYSFGLPDLEPGGAGQLTLWLIGYTALPAEPDHRVGVGLNGAPLGAVEWDGKRAVSATLEVPAALLQVEGNILGLTLTGLPDVPIEGAWLDAFALRYVRSIMPQGATAVFEGEAGRCAYSLALTDSGGLHAYDVSDPLRPRALSGFELQGNTVTLGDPEAGGGRRYYLAADCGLQRPPVRPQADPWSLNPGGAPPGTDWLAITPPQLAPALAPLLELRASQGLSVTLVNLEGIYDQWGDGQPDPEAIHALIAATYTWWSPRPSYVLLVGDGSFDPKQHRPDSPPTLLPPYLANVDPWAGETAADNRYACVDGDDALPDLLLGRLPVQDLAQAQEVVDKIVQYETAPASIPWKAQVLLVADDADASGDFPASSEAHAAALVRAPFYAARHYCSGTSDQQSDCPPAEAADIHRALLAGWGRGALLVQFIGHSSWHQWAVEKFFHLEDVSSLQNGPRLPIVLEMTCFTGAFQRPEATLDESLLCQAGGGAVAAWGPSGLGISAGHNQLSEGFFQAVFWGEAGTLGEAALAGKLALAAEGQNLDLLDTYNLLGDPALHLDLELPPWPGRVFVPLVYK
ncbi:MAG: hypothetical protein JXA37_06120, partial [Chloroflexia bacterium]|nr:hypothetical protein [Chloroflexia bacterium]